MMMIAMIAWRRYFDRNCGVTMLSAASASTTIGSSKLMPNVITIAKRNPKYSSAVMSGFIDAEPKSSSQGSASGTTTRVRERRARDEQERAAEQHANADALLVLVQRRRQKQPELVQDDRAGEHEPDRHRRVQRDAELVARMREVEDVLRADTSESARREGRPDRSGA